ncbi:MAG: hypothetical protein PHT07_20650 [Paludibacter sp.]|nr:hypothetical protein [Paludibacter sp.]
MITVDMIKKHLPDDIDVRDVSEGRMINMDAKSFICSFPEKYNIGTDEKHTAFAVVVSGLDYVSCKSENELDDLIKSRCEIAYKIGLEHHKKYIKREK